MQLVQHVEGELQIFSIRVGGCDALDVRRILLWRGQGIGEGG
ncbi:hypothetical protein ACFQ60_02630 [Streptomyces zhihengii]